MHRATGLNSSFRGYTAGGAASTVHGADDTKLMQEMAGGFMKNEMRQALQAPQNFGFTSVVMDAIKSGAGQIMGAAETFASFMGGNRSFPVAGNMDDRRHRLNGLEKGEASSFATQGMMQQIHHSLDGMFGSAPNDKTLRMALLDDSSQQDMTSQSFQSQSGNSTSAAGVAVNDLDFLEVDKKGATHFIHVDRQGMRHRFRRVFPLGITNYSHVVPMPTPLDASGGGGGSDGGGAGGAGAGGDGMKIDRKSVV